MLEHKRGRMRSGKYTHTHARTHASTHARTHARMYARTHTTHENYFTQKLSFDASERGDSPVANDMGQTTIVVHWMEALCRGIQLTTNRHLFNCLIFLF